MRLFVILLACLAASAHATQVYRCKGPTGQTVFQQAPCMDGTQVDVAPTNSVAAEKPAPLPASASAPAASPAAPEPAAATARADAAKLSLEAIADKCLDWYRPRLRDPRGAYQREARLDKTVLHLTIYATNRFGGYVSKAAACEVKGGDLDVSWSAIHAKRLGW
jgi:hypothetical protein